MICTDGKVQDSDAETNTGGKKRRAKVVIDLETDADGYPLLPSSLVHLPSSLEGRKQLIRSFVTDHYRKSQST